MRALVLGASGRIGMALTKRLLSNGWNVAACFKGNSSGLDELQATFGDAIRVTRVDLMDITSLKRGIRDSGDQLGGFDAMVNAAGVAGKPEFLIRASADRIHELVGVNLTGAILATKYALPFLIRQTTSTVLNVSSVSANAPTAGVSAYAATKSGVEGFTLALGREYAQRGLAANCVRLGPVGTPMLEALGQDSVNDLALALPRKVLPSLSRVAEVLEHFLIQGLHGTINGSISTIDSGYTMWRNG